MKDLTTNFPNIDQKLELLTNPNTLKGAQSGYVLGFIHPKTSQQIFLANIADIRSICYSECPILPGTYNIKLAKFYSTIDEVKADIYLLRYHHRRFLKVRTFAKPAMHFHAELELSPSSESIECQNYMLAELIYSDDSDPFEN